MKKSIQERIEKEAKYIIEENATIQQTAKKFNVSTTTIFMDMTIKLKTFDEELANSVNKIFKTNKAERHIRGGLATKEKWAKVNKQ